MRHSRPGPRPTKQSAKLRSQPPLLLVKRPQLDARCNGRARRLPSADALRLEMHKFREELRVDSLGDSDDIFDAAEAGKEEREWVGQGKGGAPWRSRTKEHGEEVQRQLQAMRAQCEAMGI